MDIGPVQEVKAVSLSRKMSKVGLLAAMKTFTKPHFQRKKKSKEKHQSRSWDSGLCHVGLPSPGQSGLGTVGSYKKIYWTEPNKEKTEHSNGSVPSGDGGGGGSVVNHSPKSCGMLSPGSGAPAGSVALPGLTGHRGHDNGVSVTVSNGSSYNGTRTVYSPEAESPPTPQPPPAPGSTHHHRPVSLNSVKGGTGKSGGKRTRWLLCYHMGGGAPSASPSPPSEHGNSQCSTPSPTDHGFKLPNSFSNERPTSLPVALLNCSGSSSGQPDAVVGRGVVVNEAVNPLSIDPNERVTPSGHGQHNGDIHDSIGVTDIGVIPPPPMFSSPSPPQPQRHIIPPPKEHQSHPPPPFGVTNARGHDLSDQHAKEMYSDEEEEEDCDEEADDDFVDLPPGVTRVVTTVPAKEPRLDAQPLKPALKQPKGSSRSQAGTPPSQNGRHHASTPPQDKHQNSSLGGGRRGAHPQFSNFREDKENIPHSDDDEDGPILYRDDDNMEDEGVVCVSPQLRPTFKLESLVMLLKGKRSPRRKVSQEGVPLTKTTTEAWEAGTH